MTVHDCSEQLKKYMVSLCEVQSCNENAYIIHYTRLRSCLALCKILKRVDMKSLLWLKLIECTLNRHLLCDTLNFESKRIQKLKTLSVQKQFKIHHLITYFLDVQENNGGQYIHCSSITQESNNLALPDYTQQANITKYLAMFLFKTL